MKFVNTAIMPATSYSSGLLGSVSSLFRQETSTDSSAEAKQIKFAHGVTVAELNELNKLQSKYVFAEEYRSVQRNELSPLCVD